jgi:biotin transport system substrate-specific component
MERIQVQTALAPTLTRCFFPRSTALANAILIILGSFFIAALAQVSIVIPPSPVPVTGQTFAVLLIGAALGARRGALCVAVYALEGGLGLPVFAQGKAGIAGLLGPTGGYIFGFIAAAFVVGYLAEHGLDRRWITAPVLFIAGQIVIYFFGLLWLAQFVGADKTLAYGLFPFLAGDAIKLTLAAMALPSAWAWANGFVRGKE